MKLFTELFTHRISIVDMVFMVCAISIGKINEWPFWIISFTGALVSVVAQRLLKIR